MTEFAANSNGIAQLGNVSAFGLLVDRVVNRQPHLPPLGVFYGKAGVGKSMAATQAAHLFRAYYVELKSLWTPKRIFRAILQEMEIAPARTAVDMFDQVCEELALSNRPLFIDDAQFLENKMELVRDIAVTSQGAIILIGEENLRKQLERWERIDSRVLVWDKAKPCALGDCRALAEMYVPELSISDELFKNICLAAKGSVRQVCNKLDALREYAAQKGVTALDEHNGKAVILSGDPARG